MKLKLALLVIFAAATLAAQEWQPAKPAPPAAKPQPTAFEETAANRIIVAYMKALAAGQAYEAACSSETARMGLPPGTGCKVDINAGTVTPQAPPVIVAPKKAEPAKK